VALTAAELREMLKLPGVAFQTDEALFQQHMRLYQHLIESNRPKQRLMKMLEKGINENKHRPVYDEKSWKLDFLKSPEEFIAGPDGRLQGVRLRENTLVIEGDTVRAIPANNTDILEAGLAISSIGYKSTPLPGTPFDVKKCIIPNRLGSVTGYHGLYASGWIKRGPTGVIGSTMQDAYETADTIIEDIKLDRLVPTVVPEPTESLLPKDHVTVSFEQWCKIDKEETKDGVAVGKPREKITSLNVMLDIAMSNSNM
jgi:adrenodoxin-NADP+ reductase